MCSAIGRPGIWAAQERLSRLKRACAEEGLDGMAIRDTANIAWLTAFRQVFDEEQAHVAFVGANADEVLIHTDSRYVTALEREAADTVFRIDAEVVSFSQWIHAAWERYRSCMSEEGHTARCFGIEDSMSLAQFRALERAFFPQNDEELTAETVLPFVETSNLILKLRAQKDDFEIRRCKAAQAVTDAAFEHIVDYMRPGMTERNVQLELDRFMLENGADGLAFPTIIACGENGASPHAIVSDKKLEAGQCVVMDFGACWEGYCSDMTRTVFLGEPSSQMQAAWECLRHANESVEAMLRPGITGRAAHELALSVLEEGGFGGRMGHGLGHGVGIEIHEEPVLSPRNEDPLVAGNVVTVEPGIYIPGSFGMRLEDFGVITEEGFEVFTQSTHEMVVI